MKKVISIVVLLAIAALFAGTTWFLYQKSRQDPVVYTTTEPFYTDIVTKTVAIGKIVPRREIQIKSQVPGVVETLFVDAGQTVERGDLIARIQLIPDMEHLARAESQLESARISFRNTERELERQRRLFAERLISESEYNRFLTDFELQREAVSSAEDNVSLIREGVTQRSGQVSNLVRATAGGMVLDVPVREGTFVIESNNFNEGTTIATVADMTDLIFEGHVDESEVGKIREGMEILLHIGALENTRFAADLEYISPKGVEDQGTIQFEIRAAISLNPDYFLRAGYSANADIILDQREHVLAINEGNILFERNGTYVEVATGPQTFERRRIVTGISDGINIEVVSGLSEGEPIKQQ